MTSLGSMGKVCDLRQEQKECFVPSMHNFYHYRLNLFFLFILLRKYEEKTQKHMLKKEYHMKLIQRTWAMGASMLLALVFSVGLLGSNPVTASAASVHANQTTVNQNVQQDQTAIKQQVAKLLKNKPGSKQIAWNEVSLDSGKYAIRFLTHASLIASTTPYTNCGGGYWCVFSSTYFGGNEVYGPGGCYTADTAWAGFIGIESYSNYTSSYIVVDDHWGHYSFNIYASHSSNTTWPNQNAWYYGEYVHVGECC